jgi:predicted nucleic acid-binding protein
VTDTIGLARYLEDNLPRGASKAFAEAEDGNAVILVPEVVVGELLYIALKGRLKVTDPKFLAMELVDKLESSSMLRQVGMSIEAWRSLLDSPVPELHDRMIHAIAMVRGAKAIITNDPELAASGFSCIW